MPRHSEGWKIDKKEGRDIYRVRFTHNKRPVERSTGHSDPEKAAEAAARIYADYIQREPAREEKRLIRRGDSPPLEELVTLWLISDTTIRPRTRKTYEIYGGHWCSWRPDGDSPLWESLVHVTDATIKQYRNHRLRAVIADTVRKELGGLRRFLDWAKDNGHLEREITVCTVPKKATGQRYEKRRRTGAPEVSPAEVEAMIRLLPEWAAQGSRKKNIESAKKKFPVRARAIVAYETGLRPTFLDTLSAPEHYRPGSTHIRITFEHDKNLYERQVPLSGRAREELDKICPDIGLVFGKHDYRFPVRKAAAAVLPPSKAEVWTMAHFRSAQATHTLEATGNIPGAMHLFGWTQVATASKYTKPSQRAAEDVIAAREQIRTKARAKAARRRG